MSCKQDVSAHQSLGVIEPPSSPHIADPLDCIKKLRAKQRVSDKRFDQIYPDPIYRLSEMHWTPVRVARRAAELLVTHDGARILDVGSGAGKFCLVGALTTEGVFTGVEQRDYLVAMCRDLAIRHKIEDASFVHGNMMDMDWAHFDGFYLFNPFVENLYGDRFKIDQGVSNTWFFYEKYIRIVQRKLFRARKDTRVVTYHGFGGDMPPGYTLVRSEPIASDKLELWVKD